MQKTAFDRYEEIVTEALRDVARRSYAKVFRLRDDAALWYAHNGVRTGKRGRPRVKGEKIDFENLDLSHCETLDIEGGRAYVFNAYSAAMRRNIRIVVHYPDAGGRKIYFSTDMEMAGRDIIEFYRTRFQIEFCLRDSKQFVFALLINLYLSLLCNR